VAEEAAAREAARWEPQLAALQEVRGGGCSNITACHVTVAPAVTKA
jgi:hypothetical protein